MTRLGTGQDNPRYHHRVSSSPCFLTPWAGDPPRHLEVWRLSTLVDWVCQIGPWARLAGTCFWWQWFWEGGSALGSSYGATGDWGHSPLRTESWAHCSNPSSNPPRRKKVLTSFSLPNSGYHRAFYIKVGKTQRTKRKILLNSPLKTKACIVKETDQMTVRFMWTGKYYI